MQRGIVSNFPELVFGVSWGSKGYGIARERALARFLWKLVRSTTTTTQCSGTYTEKINIPAKIGKKKKEKKSI